MYLCIYYVFVCMYDAYLHVYLYIYIYLFICLFVDMQMYFHLHMQIVLNVIIGSSGAMGIYVCFEMRNIVEIQSELPDCSQPNDRYTGIQHVF